MTLGSPVFFKQTRVGQGGKKFTMVKFRTLKTGMSKDEISPELRRGKGLKTTNAFCLFLRKTGLDELPQLIHVLKGEMSLIGPRPEMPFIVEQYGPLERERFTVKPGITGLAQISGCRGEIKSEKDMINRIKFDVFYIENWSLILDLKIISQTVVNVLKGEEKAY